MVRPKSNDAVLTCDWSRDTHALVLADTTNNSFGNYSCVARNNLGTYK